VTTKLTDEGPQWVLRAEQRKRHSPRELLARVQRGAFTGTSVSLLHLT